MALLDLPAAAGTPPDVTARLRAVLPSGWFADEAPILAGVLSGLAAGWSVLFGLLATVQAQSRLATAGGVFLDLVAQDFYGTGLYRRAGEPDAVLRGRISAGLLAPRNTRAALVDAVTALTHRTPRVIEPARIADTGAYNTPATLAYGVAGAYGSANLPFQVFVHAYRPVGIGVANSAGYGGPSGGYGVGDLQYTTPDMAASGIRDADILATIAAVVPAATIAWVAISN